ncbi:HPP family protein [Undibacterium sp. FT137W]|uniref:HPP family protein n=1 Tax=Undibacterium fentianense TaxID=2828728 RepID=A0A941E110_9BURK|nr:HPP family protein [Undibacterium fentianense]MBR7798689.1 HPP family protein [Undibacterium fentianense]
MAAAISRQVLGTENDLPSLIAPMGASAVLLFIVHSSPLAQPWPMLFGNSISAVIGVTCLILFGSSASTAALAAGLAIIGMLLSNSLHPPGGAIALLIGLGGSHYSTEKAHLFLPLVLSNSLCLLLAAIIFHRLSGQDYPHQRAEKQNLHLTKDLLPGQRLDVQPQDIDAVIDEHGKGLDISRTDLEFLFAQMEMRVYRRHHQDVRCEDVMSKNLICIQYETPISEIWQLLRLHKIKTLPVLNGDGELIGLVTLIDFLKFVNLDALDEFDVQLQQVIDWMNSWKGRRDLLAGHIMNTSIKSVLATSSVIELVPMLSDEGLHQIPIVDHDKKLVGMLTQSDLIAILFRLGLDASSKKHAIQ